MQSNKQVALLVPHLDLVIFSYVCNETSDHCRQGGLCPLDPALSRQDQLPCRTSALRLCFAPYSSGARV